MRIIAGDYRGRRLLAPRDESVTRPMTDRVKQSLFDRLTAHGFFEENEDGTPIHAVDLFAGTGSLGLEALSRGADFCTFVESDRDAADRLERNVAALEAEPYSRVLRSDALNPSWMLRLDATPITMALLDPPYRMVEPPEDFEKFMPVLAELRPRLAQIACVMLRTPKGVTPPAVAGFRGPGAQVFGATQLNYYLTDTTPEV